MALAHHTSLSCEKRRWETWFCVPGSWSACQRYHERVADIICECAELDPRGTEFKTIILPELIEFGAWEGNAAQGICAALLWDEYKSRSQPRLQKPSRHFMQKMNRLSNLLPAIHKLWPLQMDAPQFQSTNSQTTVIQSFSYHHYTNAPANVRFEIFLDDQIRVTVMEWEEDMERTNYVQWKVISEPYSENQRKYHFETQTECDSADLSQCAVQWAVELAEHAERNTIRQRKRPRVD